MLPTYHRRDHPGDNGGGGPRIQRNDDLLHRAQHQRPDLQPRIRPRIRRRLRRTGRQQAHSRRQAPATTGEATPSPGLAAARLTRWSRLSRSSATVRSTCPDWSPPRRRDLAPSSSRSPEAPEAPEVTRTPGATPSSCRQHPDGHHPPHPVTVNPTGRARPGATARISGEPVLGQEGSAPTRRTPAARPAPRKCHRRALQRRYCVSSSERSAVAGIWIFFCHSQEAKCQRHHRHRKALIGQA